MTLQTGSITGITELSVDPGGTTALNSTTVMTRKAYLVMLDVAAAYTGSTDTATLTGICTAIAASERNGKTISLIAAMPAIAGIDTASQGVHLTGTSVQALTIANGTTTGDVTGQLSDASGTEVTTTTGATTGIGIVVVIDSTPGP